MPDVPEVLANAAVPEVPAKRAPGKPTRKRVAVEVLRAFDFKPPIGFPNLGRVFVLELPGGCCGFGFWVSEVLAAAFRFGFLVRLFLF